MNHEKNRSNERSIGDREDHKGKALIITRRVQVALKVFTER